MTKLAAIADYMVAFINEFGQRYDLTDVQAFRYLWQYGAIDAISANYEAAHTLTFDDVCSTATRICAKNGGYLQ